MSGQHQQREETIITDPSDTTEKARVINGRLQTDVISGPGGGDGAIQDGANAAIEATVLDLTNSNPLTVAITDGSGTQITSFGGGTQYADGTAVATPTGTVALGHDGANVRAITTDATGILLVDTELPAGAALGDADANPTTPRVGACLQAWNGATWYRAGGSAAGGLEVNLGANNDVTVTSGNIAVTGSVTANAGTNLNTSLLALETGGNLAAAATSLNVVDDWDETDRCKVNPIAGQAGVQGASGIVTALTQRVVLATDVALPAGTNGIGKLTANSGVDIGDVDVLTCGTITPGTGATNLGKAEDGGHTTSDVGIMALGVRVDVPNTAASSGDADYQYVAQDKVGGVRTALYETDFAVLGTNHVKKYYTSAGAVTNGIVWSPAAGKRWYVTDIFINISAAATITLNDETGPVVLWKAELAANSGWSHSFRTPLFSGTDAADLLVTTSAGNVYITVTGYEV